NSNQYNKEGNNFTSILRNTMRIQNSKYLNNDKGLEKLYFSRGKDNYDLWGLEEFVSFPLYDGISAGASKVGTIKIYFYRDSKRKSTMDEEPNESVGYSQPQEYSYFDLKPNNGFLFCIEKSKDKKITDLISSVNKKKPEIKNLFSSEFASIKEPGFLGIDSTKLKVKFNVDFTAKEETAPLSPATEPQIPEVIGTGDFDCNLPGTSTPGGYTGSDNYNKYGFNRLAFSTPVFSENQDAASMGDLMYCNLGSNYCDQQQFAYALRFKTSQLTTVSNQQRSINSIGNRDIYFLTEASYPKIKEYISTKPFKLTDYKKFESVGPAKPTVIDLLNYTSAQIDNLPAELKKFTIVDIKFKDESSKNMFLKNVKELNLGFNNYQIPKDTEYHIQYLLTDHKTIVNNFNTILDTASKAKNTAVITEVNNILMQYLSGMQVYYAVPVNQSLVTLKPNVDIKTGKTLSKTQMEDVFNKFLDSASSGRKIDLTNYDDTISKIWKNDSEPKVYLLTITNVEDLKNNPNATIKFTLTEVDSKLQNEFNRFPEYKKNLFFKQPINPGYYAYGVGAKNFIKFTGGRTTLKDPVFNVFIKYESKYVLSVIYNSNSNLYTWDTWTQLSDLTVDNTLQEFIDKINTNEVCFSVDNVGTEMKFWYNPDTN
ncbi:MAG: hypothetical protein V1824_04605, partial [archaeon]